MHVVTACTLLATISLLGGVASSPSATAPGAEPDRAAVSPPNDTASADSAVRAFYAGRWACVGTFASGKPIAADVEFAILDERWMRMEHRDRAPSQWHAHAFWGRARPSLPFMAVLVDNGSGTRQFVAEVASPDSVVFRRDTTSNAVTTTERFSYVRTGRATYRMRYELERGGTRRMIDHVDCERPH